MRVIHTPHAIGGSFIGLSKAEKSLGIDSRTVSFLPHPFGYEIDYLLAKSQLGVEIKRYGLFRNIRNNADVVHFYFGQSLYPHVVPDDVGGMYSRIGRKLYNLYSRPLEWRDLELLKKERVGIVVTFLGDDARLGTQSKQEHLMKEAGYYSEAGDEIKRNRIKKWDEYADHIFAITPDLLEFLPGRTEFLPSSAVNPASIQYMPRSTSEGETVRITHAPSHQGVKGSRFVLAALEKIMQTDKNVEFDLIENESHSRTMARCSGSDLLVDQLILGWYGGLAVEAMSMGVPVVANINEIYAQRIDKKMEKDLPIASATPETIERTLLECIEAIRSDRNWRRRASREFVETWHNPNKTAERTKKIYGDILQKVRIENQQQ